MISRKTIRAWARHLQIFDNFSFQVWHDDRGDLRRGLHPPEQRGDGAGARDGEPQQAGVRPGDDNNNS